MSRLDPQSWSTAPRDGPGYPRPYQAHSATSREAAESISDKSLGDLHRLVYAYLLRTGGATDEAGALALGLSGNTYRPRRRELEEQGYVERSGRRDTTQSGRSADVWRITGKGRGA